jgi:hypothetical protein
LDGPEGDEKGFAVWCMFVDFDRVGHFDWRSRGLIEVQFVLGEELWS